MVLSVSRVGSSDAARSRDVRVESLREASQPGVVSVLLEKNVSMPGFTGARFPRTRTPRSTISARP